MDGDLPTSFDQDYIENILKKAENDDTLRVTNMSIKRATSKGDNYTSDMFRVSVEYIPSRTKQTETKSIIFKVAPTKDGLHKDFIQGSGIFNIEINMMTDTLNKMNELLGDPRALSAKCIYVQREDPQYLMIEDLAQLGFRMASREHGLDLEHAMLAVHGLAKFHASSVAICEKDPTIKDKYNSGIFGHANEQMKTQMDKYFSDSLEYLAEEIATWPGPVAKLSSKIKNLTNHMDELLVSFREVHVGNSFNVINHGDCWVNNMLFKYDANEKPIRQIFVDFQLCRYGSPALDLHYFFGTSLVEDLYLNKQDVLLEEYLKILSILLKQLKCQTKPPTMDELKQMLKERARIRLIASFMVLPVILVEKENVVTVDEMLQPNGTFRNPGIKSKRYIQTMTKRLPIFDQMGLFDF